METLVLVNLILKVVFIFTAFLNMIIILIDYYICEESFNQSGFFGWLCASLWCFTSFF